MFRKFLVCILFVITVHATDQQDQLDLTLQDFIKNINKIYESIQNVTKNIPEIIKEFFYKIDDLLPQINFKEILKKIIELLGRLLGIDELNNECIQKFDPEIKEIAQKEVDAMLACVKIAQTNIGQFENESKTIENEAKDIVKNTEELLEKCRKDPTAILMCLKDLYMELKDSTVKILEDGQKLIMELKDTILEANKNLENCTKYAGEESKKEIDLIIEKIKDCGHK